MKRIIMIIIFMMILLPFNVKAQTVLDNYSIIITIDSHSVRAVEQFDVVEVGERDYFTKKIFADNTKLKTYLSPVSEYKNIDEYKIIDEDKYYPLIVGKVKANNSYIIDYEISDYTMFGTHAFDFYAPEDTVINNLFLLIKYNYDEITTDVYGYNENLYKIEDNGEYISGNLLEPSSNPNFSLNVNPINDDESHESNDLNDSNSSLLQLFRDDKSSYLSYICISFTIICGIIMYKLRDRVRKIYTYLYIFTVIGLIVLEYVLTFPTLLFILAFYLLFYIDFLYSKESKPILFIELFIIILLAFHSYMFIGSAVGIVPHLLNCISIYISARFYRLL